MTTQTTPGPTWNDLRTAISDLAHNNYAHHEQAVWELFTRAEDQQAALIAALTAALPFLQALAVNPDANDADGVLNPVLEAVAQQARAALGGVKR